MQIKPLIRLAFVATALTLSVIPVTQAMPEAIEMDRFMLAAETNLKANRLEEVAKYLEKIEKLSKTPPALYHYYRAQVARGNGDEKQERSALEAYVSLAGKTGEYYSSSLVRITELEQGVIPREKTAEQVLEAGEQNNVLSGQESLLKAFQEDKEKDQQIYADKLKKLYLKASYNEALVAHINELLATHAFTGKRIQNANDDKALTYSISIADDKSSILSVKKNSLEDPERLITDKTVVFGQNLFLKHQCDVARAYCVVKKPDLYMEWFKISYDETAAKEITEALSQLMSNLQRDKDM